MIVLYPLFSTLFLLLLTPLLLPLVLWKKKYRLRILRRLGIGLDHRLQLPATGQRQPVIWLHALSVGEVTSALPLVQGLRRHLPAATLLFSAATASGMRVAEDLVAPHVDLVFDAPLDLYWTIRRHIHLLRPSLFILVETDLWPGWLNLLHRKRIPILLVNGRISDRSLARYQRFSFLFRPMFRSFDLMAMQTRRDAERLAALGVAVQRVTTLGNLKYDTTPPPHTGHGRTMNRRILHLPARGPLWVCGSTHPGEETIILAVFAELRRQVPDLCLLVAPRDIARAGEVVDLARRLNLPVTRRSTVGGQEAAIVVLDTIGELKNCYALASVAFVGGSLVAQGGHNPIEPAAFAVPVLFGPHMEDFVDIAADLVRCGGGRTVTDQAEMTDLLARLLADQERRLAMGRAARGLVAKNRGVVNRHLAVIDTLLQQGSG